MALCARELARRWVTLWAGWVVRGGEGGREGGMDSEREEATEAVDSS
jgi:hypothetical protein